MRRPLFFILLAALVAVSPVLIFGTSCGHDMAFHLQNWVEAAAQFRHGTLYPQWAFATAWQSGEPRFIFYPPLSWMFGATLTLLLPMAAAPNAFVLVAILTAGYSMYFVARRFTSPNAALVAACVYLANPYMFFNAFERSAYAELLAAIWIPLLFLAVLRERYSLATGAASLALAWLTNVPAGIIATYTFLVLVAVRFSFDWQNQRSTAGTCPPERKEGSASLKASHYVPPGNKQRRAPLLQSYLLPVFLTFIIGLTLPAFYLLPALNEKHYVQSSMLMIENLRYQDNYLFHNTAWVPHNVVTRTVSLIAVAMLVATACVLIFLFLQRRKHLNDSKLRRTSIPLAALFTLILFLLLPISGFIWHITPELAFLQFPWRLLTILSAVLALALALALRTWTKRPWLAPALGLLYVAAATGISSHLYRQACEVPHMAQTTLDTFNNQHGVAPTDEYTPGDADNDVLRFGSPGYWLAPTKDPSAYAPGTMPNPNEYDPTFDSPIPYRYTWGRRAPTHLDLNLQQPAVLVLNLRDFPNWRITRNGSVDHDRLRRDDGLTAIPLSAGPTHIDIAWHRGWDGYAGDTLSLASLTTLLFLRRRETAARLKAPHARPLE